MEIQFLQGQHLGKQLAVVASLGLDDDFISVVDVDAQEGVDTIGGNSNWTLGRDMRGPLSKTNKMGTC